MSEDNKSQISSPAADNNNETQFFIGTPSHEEVKSYFLRHIRETNDRNKKVLKTLPEVESSPELSESFNMLLNMRKQKTEEERNTLTEPSLSPRSSRKDTFTSQRIRPSCLNNTTVNNPENSMAQFDDDSFLANEKMCEQTLHLNNVSEPLFDFTAFDMTVAGRKSKITSDETHLNDVEQPSFMFNNSSMISPNKHSPMIPVNANRPSTILEVTECSSSKTFMSSYRTAVTRSGTETESVYKTANEDSFGNTRSIDEKLMIKMPKIRSFYDADMTKDSLDSEKTQMADEMTKDSLNPTNLSSGVEEKDESSSGIDSSYDHRENEANESAADNFNDTLERFEFMLAQGQKIQEATRTIPSSPMTPRVVASSSAGPSSSSKYLQPKVFSKDFAHSPLIKFSPNVKKSPMIAGSSFKMPTSSATKQPFSANKKFSHVESPIARYIFDTPGAPLISTARGQFPGMGGSSSKHFNFRDSDSFAKENENTNSVYKGSSLPLRAKTKSSAVCHVFDHRDSKKTPCGAKIQSLIGKSPTVVVHQGHIKTPNQPQVFKKQLLNETALSDQSFADLSLISGDVSVQVVEGVKRFMK